ncbi:MAG: terminase family protein [Akkermansia sp.]|nr:terminase family protein [Akkermansia sp.]
MKTSTARPVTRSAAAAKQLRRDKEAKPKGSAQAGHVSAPAVVQLPSIETAKKLLFPYQRAWVEDESRFLVGRWGRQTGKSFSTAFIVASAMASTPNTEWMIAAPSERQSHEALDKVKQWLESFGILYHEYVDALNDIESKAGVVKLSNGSRCVAVPGKPNTVRGFSANVWLDEFAFFEDPDATWKAILPSITNPLKGGQKRVILTSTPNGMAGTGRRFYDICTAKKSRTKWQQHHIPLSKAVQDGLPVDYEELVAAIDNPLAVLQELEAEFVDTASQLLPNTVILRAESAEASAICGYELYCGGHDIRIGIDIGRVSDPTVIWTAERLGDVLVTREVVVLKDVSHDEQYKLMMDRVAGCTRCCLDYTGQGIGLGDFLASKFGVYDPKNHKYGKMELCTFTPALKRQIFPKLRDAMEGALLRIPADAAIRTDFAAMQQTCRGGDYSYESVRTRDGHSDRCTAAALCVRAGEGSGNVPLPGKLPSKRKREYLHARRNHIGGGMRRTNYELRRTK